MTLLTPSVFSGILWMFGKWKWFYINNKKEKRQMDKPWKGAPVLCDLKRSKTPKVCKVPCDGAIELVKKCFDYKFEGESTVFPFEVPQELLDLDVNIIQIYGPSGAGKSTFLKAFEKAGWHFPKRKYDTSKAIISNFSENPVEGLRKFNAVGLGSKPTYCRPRNVLSTGEGFRADMALNIESKVMIDEYTSVVNRETARAASYGIQGYIREQGYKNVILCGCHDDIVEYLKPDILVDLESEKVYDLRGFCLGKTLTSPSNKSMGRRSERSGRYSLHITI